MLYHEEEFSTLQEDLDQEGMDSPEEEDEKEETDDDDYDFEDDETE